MVYRVTEHLVDLHFVAIKVGSSDYPMGQLRIYSNGPLVGKTFLKCVDKG